MVVVQCPGCPTRLSAPEGAAGKQLKCPKCGALATVPNEQVVESKPAAPPKPKPKVTADPVEDDDDRPRSRKRRDEDDDDDDRPRKKKSARE